MTDTPVQNLDNEMDPDTKRRFDSFVERSWNDELSIEEQQELARICLYNFIAFQRYTLFGILQIMGGTKEAAKETYEAAGYKDMDLDRLCDVLAVLDKDQDYQAWLVSVDKPNDPDNGP